MSSSTMLSRDDVSRIARANRTTSKDLGEDDLNELDDEEAMVKKPVQDSEGNNTVPPSSDDNLRNRSLERKQSSSSKSPNLNRQKSSNTQPVKTARDDDANKEALFEVAVEHAPPFMKPYLLKLQVAINFISRCLNVAGPYIEGGLVIAERVIHFIQRYYIDEVAIMILGVFMMMFGGYFFTVIACFEAYRAVGLEKTIDNIKIIVSTINRFREANNADDQADEDHDGVADVRQIDSKMLFARKVRLLLREIDPDALTNAFSGLYAGFIAVMATVKIQFARTLAIGVAIGDALTTPALKFVSPQLKRMIAPEYGKWVDVLIRYACKTIGLSVAMKMQAFVSAFHSAYKGAQLFTTYFAIYTARKGFMGLSKGYWDETFCVLLCGFGLYTQITNFMQPPAVVRFLMFPLVALENFLQWLMIYDVTASTTPGGPAVALADIPSAAAAAASAAGAA